MLRFLIILLPMAYVAWHLWLVVPLPAWGKWGVVALEAIGIGIFILGMTRYNDRLPLWLASAVYDVGSTVVIVLAYLFMLCLAADVLRLVHVVPTAWVKDSMAATLAVAALLTATLTAGNVHYRHKQRVELSLDSNGKVNRPLKAVCISDLHLGYHTRRAELARWVDIINAERPDAVLVAGDVIDRSLRPLLAEGMAAELQRIEAPVFACPGNHEHYASYYHSASAVERFYADAGITLLRDSVATLAGGTIGIIGRDDRINPRRRPAKELMSHGTLGDSTYTILLDHQPYNLEEAEQAGVNFQFSGHTHRGQFWPVSWITDAIYECSWGSHRRGATNYYVTSGLGIWGPKYRIGTQSEYIVVNIR